MGTSGDNDAIFSGLSCVMNLVTGGANRAMLQSYSPKMFVWVKILGFALDARIMFKMIVSWSTRLSQYWRGNWG